MLSACGSRLIAMSGKRLGVSQASRLLSITSFKRAIGHCAWHSQSASLTLFQKPSRLA